jgi:DNA-binding CsgD family transcriptional regulator
MANRVGFEAAQQRVRALAYAGLSSVEFRLAVLRELNTVIHVDASFFSTADPATLLHTSAVRLDIPDDLGALFLDNEFRTPDVNKFRCLAAGPDRVATLERATHGDWSVSARSEQIMQPAGLGDELRVAFRTSTTTWGFACLHREAGAPFGEDEIAFVAGIAPHIGEALRRCVMTERAVRDSAADGPGVVTLAPDLTLVAATPSGERWLADLAAVDHPASRPQPVAVLAVARALAEVETAGATPRLTVRAASGRWLVLHAAHLTSAQHSQVAVVIEPASRAELEPMIAAGYALTAREAETLTLVLRGLATKTIANQLRVTQHTANDHIKAIYTKTGVNSRGELMATVFRDASAGHR